MIARLIGTLLLVGVAGVAGARVERVSARVAAAAPHAPLLTDLTPERVEILLAVEDPGFRFHHGVDIRTPGSGWTTVTQSIVKAYGYDAFAPGFAHWRKIEQSLAALVVDRRVSKDAQLALFVDGAYFGEHDGRTVRGFRDAARTYFSVSLPLLTDEQYLALVAMLPAPNRLSVTAHPERNAERVARIQRLLAGRCRPAGWRDVMYQACVQEEVAGR